MMLRVAKPLCITRPHCQSVSCRRVFGTALLYTNGCCPAHLSCPSKRVHGRNYAAAAFAQRQPERDQVAQIRRPDPDALALWERTYDRPISRSNSGKQRFAGKSGPSSRERGYGKDLRRASQQRVDPHLHEAKKYAIAQDSARGPIYDAQQILDRSEMPTHADYPNIDLQIFDSLESVFERVPEAKVIQTHSNRGGVLEATLAITISSLNVHRKVFQGKGITKTDALKAARLYAITQFHKSGMLGDILKLVPGRISQHLKAQEQGAKSDILDYCARFDAMPNIKYSKSSRGNGNYTTCNIEFLSQGISARGRAKEYNQAEILACLDFKRQAEQWHLKHGEGPIQVKHILSLNLKNASMFFEYYKTTNPGAVFDVHVAQASHVDISTNQLAPNKAFFIGYVTLDGQSLAKGAAYMSKKDSEAAAWLTGAVELKRREPEMLDGFLEALKDGNGQIIKPSPPIWLRLGKKCVDAMTDTLQQVRRFGLARGLQDFDAETENTQPMRRTSRRLLDGSQKEAKNKLLKQAYDAYQTNPEIVDLREKRQDLPMNQHASKVLKIVEENSVSIIVGATGSGKTTQVPQIIFEDAIRSDLGANCNIICTQPRRIAAISVAQRVAVERNEKYQQTVGHQVRFDAKLPQFGGSITFCTTGILLQQLRNSADEALEGVTHLLIDEVHERDILIDFLLIILKRVMAQRRAEGKSEIKIVLMSATIDTELFANYFRSVGEGGKEYECPSISVPGRTFPVKEFYLEDIQNEISTNHGRSIITSIRDPDTRKYLQLEEDFRRQSGFYNADQAKKRNSGEQEEIMIDWKRETVIGSDGQVSASNEKEDGLLPIPLIALTIAHIAKTTQEGAILVFLPGLAEITAVHEELSKNSHLGVDFNDKSRYQINLLHSSLPAGQIAVFDKMEPGRRKIILSTNIAETSVTITDVRYVVDSGKLREKQYAQAARVTRLLTAWISKSNSKQRAGRAGRVQDGNYYALFSRNRAQSLKATGLPEMLRSDLQEICLDIKAQGFKDPVAQFLSEAIEPPSMTSIEASLEQLRKLNALDKDERLTPLGRVLSTMPVEPALGKMILLGVIFRCLDPMIIIGAAADTRDLFVNPLEKKVQSKAAKHSFVRDSGSDQMATINAFRQWREIRDKEGPFAAARFADINFLHHGALKTLDQTSNQIEEVLVTAGIVPLLRPENRFRGEIGHPRLNDNASSVPLIKALSLAGNYPNIAIAVSGRGLRTAKDNFAMIHPASINYPKNDRDVLPFGTVVSYGSKALSNDGNSTFLRQTSLSSVLSTLLFGGNPSLRDRRVILDSWLPVQCDRLDVLRTVGDFRALLDRILLIAFQDLSKRGSDSSGFLADEPARATFAKGFVEVLEQDIDLSSRQIQHRSSSTSSSSSFPGELSFVGRAHPGRANDFRSQGPRL